MKESEKIYNEGCYFCKNEETTFCDGCPVKEAIIEAENREKKNSESIYLLSKNGGIMVTDEMMDAINMLIDLCSNEEQANGMASVREMLADFGEGEWLDMEHSERCEWLKQYL